VIANDVDVDGDPFTITSVLGGVNGNVVIDARMPYSRRGTAISGNAAFLYTVTDSLGAIGYGTVNLEVLPTYHLPISHSDSGLTMLQDTTLDIDPALLLANDIDPDGNPLTFLVLPMAGDAAGQRLLSRDARVQFIPGRCVDILDREWRRLYRFPPRYDRRSACRA